MASHNLTYYLYCKKWITDGRNGSKTSDQDNIGLMNEFIPKTIDTNCEYIDFVIGDNQEVKEAIELQTQFLSKNFKVRLFNNIEEARLWTCLVVRNPSHGEKENNGLKSYQPSLPDFAYSFP